MDSWSTDLRQGILVLLPFLAKGALSLSVMRAMRDRGLDVHVAFYIRGGGGYTPDPADDLTSEGRLIDMSTNQDATDVGKLNDIICQRHIGLVVQIGSPFAYHQLPYLKERQPGLRVIDVLYNRVGHTLNHFLYEACFDGVIVESLDMKSYMLTNTSNSAVVVHLVESGIDLTQFIPLSDALQKSGEFSVGYIGRMSPEKNPIGFIDLAERLHTTLPSLRFRMFGEGGMAEEVQARIAAGTAAAVIHFEGYVDRAISALSELNVLIVPSKLDGRPNIVMEANACGVPVIGAPVGGIPELIEPGRNGAVLAPTEYDHISTLLAGWVADPIAFGRLRASSRNCAEKRFDRRHMLDRYEAVFRSYVTSPVS
jgi:glycosyltransferase involved in cell wall biosynthesis